MQLLRRLVDRYGKDAGQRWQNSSPIERSIDASFSAAANPFISDVRRITVGLWSATMRRHFDSDAGRSSTKLTDDA
jgi:hypothetical protein